MRWAILIYTVIVFVLMAKCISQGRLLDRLSVDFNAANDQLDAAHDIIADLTEENEGLKYERDLYLSAYKEAKKK